MRNYCSSGGGEGVGVMGLGVGGSGVGVLMSCDEYGCNSNLWLNCEFKQTTRFPTNQEAVDFFFQRIFLRYNKTSIVKLKLMKWTTPLGFQRTCPWKYLAPKWRVIKLQMETRKLEKNSQLISSNLILGNSIII